MPELKTTACQTQMNELAVDMLSDKLQNAMNLSALYSPSLTLCGQVVDIERYKFIYEFSPDSDKLLSRDKPQDMKLYDNVNYNVSSEDLAPFVMVLDLNTPGMPQVISPAHGAK